MLQRIWVTEMALVFTFGGQQQTRTILLASLTIPSLFISPLTRYFVLCSTFPVVTVSGYSQYTIQFRGFWLSFAFRRFMNTRTFLNRAPGALMYPFGSLTRRFPATAKLCTGSNRAKFCQRGTLVFPVRPPPRNSTFHPFVPRGLSKRPVPCSCKRPEVSVGWSGALPVQGLVSISGNPEFHDILAPRSD